MLIKQNNRLVDSPSSDAELVELMVEFDSMMRIMDRLDSGIADRFRRLRDEAMTKPLTERMSSFATTFNLARHLPLEFLLK